MKLAPRHIGIIVCGLATAFLHLGLMFPDFQFNAIILNGFGYIGLLGAYFLPIPFFQQKHKLVWWALVGYTILTIVLWVFLGDLHFVFGTHAAIGYYAKTAELLLLFFLWRDRK